MSTSRLNLLVSIICNLPKAQPVVESNVWLGDTRFNSSQMSKAFTLCRDRKQSRVKEFTDIPWTNFADDQR